jgi:hypothetical protein
MSNQSLYLIDTNTVAYCEFCRNVAAFHSSFETRHRLFVIDTNSDLASFLSKSVKSFPSATSHPHFRFLEEASSRRIWGPLNFRSDLGSLLEAVTHYCTDLTLSPCEPDVCNLAHIRVNKRKWLHLTLNLDNCSSCAWNQEHIYRGRLENFGASFIPSWAPKEAAKTPACSTLLRLQPDSTWTTDFHRTCPSCKRRRLLRTEYTLGLRTLWSRYYSENTFCSCPFACFAAF